MTAPTWGKTVTACVYSAAPRDWWRTPRAWLSLLVVLSTCSVALGSSSWEDAFKAALPSGVAAQLEAEPEQLIGWKDRDSRTLLHLAAEYATLAATVEALLDLGVEPNVHDRFQRTALQVALITNPHSAVTLALALDPRINVTISASAASTPMQLALFTRDDTIIRRIADRVVVEATATARDRELALEWLAEEQATRASAASQSESDAAQRSAQANRVQRVERYRDAYGESTPTGYTPSEKLYHAIAANDASYLVGTMRSLARGWSLGLLVNGKSIAWHAATRANSPDVVAVLVAEGLGLILPEGESPHGDQTLLNAAIRAKRSSGVLNAWIAAGALRATADAAASAIDLATSLPADLEVVELLVTAAADLPGAQDAVARGAAWLDFEHLLLGAQEDLTVLFRLVTEGATDTLSNLEARGVSLKATDETGAGLVHQAARSGAPHTLVWLLDQGLPVDLRDRAGNTPLTAALSAGASHGIVDTLLTRGANFYLALGSRLFGSAQALESGLVKAEPQSAELIRAAVDGVFTLHNATQRGDVGRLDLLLQAGHKVNERDADGRTALMLASASGDAALLGLLINAGSNPWLVDNAGRDAQSYAEAAARSGENSTASRALALLVNRLERGSWLGVWRGTILGTAGMLDLTLVIDHEARVDGRVLFTGTVYLGQPWVGRPLFGDRGLEGYSGELLLDSSAVDGGIRLEMRATTSAAGAVVGLSGSEIGRQLNTISVRLFRVAQAP